MRERNPIVYNKTERSVNRMDTRTEIINKVVEALADVEQDVIERVERVLHIQLADYEISERCTAVTVHDNSNMGMVRKFIATKRLEGKSESTLRKYQPELEKLVMFLDKRIFEVETYDLRLYLSLYKENRRVSNRTLDNIRKTICSFFSWLHDEGHVGRNPARALKQIKYTKEVKKAFTPVEREKLKNACRFLRDLALSEFLYASGLRVSEAVSLDIRAIDFQRREATVVGKGGKERKFYLSEVCLEYLKQYIDSRTDSNPALFVSVKAPYGRMGKEGIEAAMRRLGVAAGVDNVHPHRFRRTLATDLVRKNVPIQDVAAILGHADLRTTQVYVCLNQEAVKFNYNRAVA